MPANASAQSTSYYLTHRHRGQAHSYNSSSIWNKGNAAALVMFGPEWLERVKRTRYLSALSKDSASERRV